MFLYVEVNQASKNATQKSLQIIEAPMMSTGNWYCIRTQRYKESWVNHQLSDLGKECYLPLFRERRIVRRQWKDVIKPLFPCYLFVRCRDSSDFHTTGTLPGAVNILGSQECGPLVVDERIIAALRQRSVQGYITVEPPLLVAGEELEVVAGPFTGVSALFQQELKAGERVAVLMQILSSSVRVELPRLYVRKKVVSPAWQSAAAVAA
jgi:transcriptional antiterminator RfaH